MRDVAARVQPVSATVSWTGTPAIDVAAGVVAQLRDAGVGGALGARLLPGARRPLLLPSRRADRPVRRRRRAERGVSGAPATAARRDELAAGLGAGAGPDPRGRWRPPAAPTSRPWSSSPSSSRPPTSTCSPSWASRAIGENRDQEAAAKCAELAHRDRLTVHFIGQLQSNKAASVAHYADVVQSVDRAKVVRALDRGARAGRPHGSRSPCRSTSTRRRAAAGVAPGEARALADLVAGSPALTLRGVMAVAPLGW